MVITSELVLLLYDEVCDGSTPVIDRLVPAQRHGLAVEVGYPRLSGLGRGL